MAYSSIFALLICVSALMISSTYADWVEQKCPASDEASKKCYIQQLNSIISKLATNSKEVTELNLPSDLDPAVSLGQVNVSVRVGEERHLRIIKLSLVNISVTGLQGLKVTDLTLGNPLQVRLQAEHLVARTHVHHLAQTVLLRSQGDGVLVFNLSDTSLDISAPHSEIQRDNQRLATLGSLGAHLTVNWSTLQLENVEDSVPKPQAQQLSTFLEANTAAISKAVVPVAEVAISQHLQNLASSLLSHLPLDSLLLPPVVTEFEEVKSNPPDAPVLSIPSVVAATIPEVVEEAPVTQGS